MDPNGGFFDLPDKNLRMTEVGCHHGTIECKNYAFPRGKPGIPAPPSRAKKGGSCPGESLPTALQNRVQQTV